MNQSGRLVFIYPSVLIGKFYKDILMTITELTIPNRKNLPIWFSLGDCQWTTIFPRGTWIAHAKTGDERY